MAITPKQITPQDIKNAKRNASKLFQSGPRGSGGGVAPAQGTSPLATQPLDAARRAGNMFPDALVNGPQTPPPQHFTYSPDKNLGEQQEEVITATGGTRTLTFDGQTTSALAYDADPATIKAALEALSNVGVDDILVEGFESANEVQTVTLGGGNTGGTFTLTFDGQTTASIAYNAPASAVQSALLALSNIGVGDVNVSGSAGGPYTVTFTGAFSKVNVPKMTGTGSLTGGANTVTVANTGSPTFTNRYLFQGAFANLDVPTLVVNTGSLTGGTATVSVIATSIEEEIAREHTQKALAAAGQLRSPSQVNNDREAFGQRKPVDIGQPGRIPGEDHKNIRQ